MQRTSAPRSTYRSRTIRRSRATEPPDETQKTGRAAILTQLVLLALCAARVAADRMRGPLTIEGSVALGLSVVYATTLVAKAMAWAARGGGPADGPF
jgi:hypothetical protein